MGFLRFYNIYDIESLHILEVKLLINLENIWN